MDTIFPQKSKSLFRIFNKELLRKSGRYELWDAGVIHIIHQFKRNSYLFLNHPSNRNKLKYTFIFTN